MHLPVEPESKRAMTDFLSAVSIVSISTFKLSEVETPPIVAMVSVLGNVRERLAQLKESHWKT